jgi:hypothetical protein
MCAWLIGTQFLASADYGTKKINLCFLQQYQSNSGLLDSPQAIFTSFKLPKPTLNQAPESPQETRTSSPENMDEEANEEKGSSIPVILIIFFLGFGN